MKRIFFDRNTMAVSGRYPHFYPSVEKDYLDVADDVYEETLSCEYGKIWKVKDGVPYLADDLEVQGSDEYKDFTNRNKICEYRAYLDSTDYVISKLSELKLEDEQEYQKAMGEYKDVLAKRKEARAKINELEGTA